MKISTLFLGIILTGLFSCNSGSKKTAENDGGFVIHRGLNASHWLSQTGIRGEEREKYMQEKDFQTIANLGFDHVRIPVDEMHLWDENGQRHEDAFQLLHNAIRWSFENDLRVIVDLHVIRSHHFTSKDNTLWSDPAEQEKFWGMWKVLSAELKKYPNDLLAYELMNEAVADDPEDWNKLIAKGIEIVRMNEPERKIVVGSNKWQQVYTFPDLKVPENDTNIILSFHLYEPFILTHYKTPWNPELMQFEGEVNYPGYTVDTSVYASLSGEALERIKNSNGYFDKDVLKQKVMIAKKVADDLGLPLFCGEFGCYPSTPMEVRVRLYKDLISIFDENGIAWTHWNYKNDFPVVDEMTLEPIPEIVKVLTGS